jgi:glycosyltransferase involved in cell wall biosynthesis
VPAYGGRPRDFLRWDTFALMMGDHETALVAAERRLAVRADEQSIFSAAVALWELGREEDAHRVIADVGAATADDRLRAATRFWEHVEDVPRAHEALRALVTPDSALLLSIAKAWRRHGRPDLAEEVLCRIAPDDRRFGRASALRRLAAADRRVLAGDWSGTPTTERLTPVPGRVLHMLYRSLPHHHAGSSYRTHYLARAQQEIGLEPHLMTQVGFPSRNGGSPGRRTEFHLGLPYHRVFDGNARAGLDMRLERNLQAACELVRELRPAVIHPASDNTNALVALELGRRFEVPVVYEVRGFPEERRVRRPGSRVLYEQFATRRALEESCWRRADRVVTLAEVMKRHIVAAGVDPARVEVVPNAIDPDVFVPVRRDHALAARMGIEPGETVVGYVSTFSAYEGIDFLVEAVSRLSRRGRRVHALLVGDGMERTHLAHLAARLGVAARVTFAGRVPHEDVVGYYALMDIFVVPRTAEATSQLVTPLKPYEAMACERPVVVSATEALREMVVEGVTGRTFDPEDAEALADVIEELMDHPARRRELGRAAREWVCENRTWRQNAIRYRAIYQDLGAI